jgi:hypothetical protein
MRTLTMTDRELQRLIAPAIRKRLKAAGFHTGTSSDDHAGFFFPIDLNLSGSVEVTRHEDGTWTFEQEDQAVADRRATSLACHAEAITGAAQRFKEG